VKLGARSDNYIEVMEGIQEGEQVVVAANFLIDAESNLKAAVAGFGQPAAKGVSNQAQGTVEDLDAAAGTVTVHHAPVASLNWPAMTMEFQVANASLLKSLKPGAKVSIEFVERKPGEWVITSVKSADPHTGH
jgi:Cu(I)/Ag(I) efflux system membrane fusion protein